MARLGLALLIATATATALAASQAASATLSVSIGPEFAGTQPRANPEHSVDIAVDGKMVGSATKATPLVLDIQPGPHTVTRYQHTIWGPKYPVPLQVTVLDAGLHLLATNYTGKADSAVLIGGLVGGAVVGAIAGAASSAEPGAHPHGQFLEVVTP